MVHVVLMSINFLVRDEEQEESNEIQESDSAAEPVQQK